MTMRAVKLNPVTSKVFDADALGLQHSRMSSRRTNILPESLLADLAKIGARLERGLTVDDWISRIGQALNAIPPELVVWAEREIVNAAGLFHGVPRHPSISIIGMFRGRSSPSEQLRHVPGLEYLFLFHGDGHYREAALKQIDGPIPSAFIFAAISWRLNDWVPEVRAAAADCASRSFARTSPEVVVRAVMALLGRQHSWRRWSEERSTLEAALRRPDVASELAAKVIAQRTGPAATVLRHALKTDALDGFLERIAQEAVQPAVRALAVKALIDGCAAWPDGWQWRWVDKPMGVRRQETVFARRTFAPTVARDQMIEDAARDRAATVRRVAVSSLIQYGLTTPQARHLAVVLLHDRSRAVREHAEFILQRNAEVQG